MYPARTRNLCEATSASAGASRNVGTNSSDHRRIVVGPESRATAARGIQRGIGYCTTGSMITFDHPRSRINFDYAPPGILGVPGLAASYAQRLPYRRVWYVPSVQNHIGRCAWAAPWDVCAFCSAAL